MSEREPTRFEKDVARLKGALEAAVDDRVEKSGLGLDVTGVHGRAFPDDGMGYVRLTLIEAEPPDWPVEEVEEDDGFLFSLTGEGDAP